MMLNDAHSSKGLFSSSGGSFDTSKSKPTDVHTTREILAILGNSSGRKQTCCTVGGLQQPWNDRKPVRIF